MEKIRYFDKNIQYLDLYQTWLDFKIHNRSNISKRKMNVYRLKTEIFKKMSNTLGFHALYHVIRPDIMVLSELNKLYYYVLCLKRLI